ncbi:GNAT family N-acetyltransferase [Colwelliaceae bacterium 6441]
MKNNEVSTKNVNTTEINKVIENVSPEQYGELLAVWENSVRATHDFISDDDIEFFKPIIMQQAFPAVTLRCIKNSAGDILGFLGVYEQKIEMLFILNEARGKGIGKMLLQHGIAKFGVNKVDVNEQNPQAAAFYQHMGFKVISRSPLDDMGKPFPILHMSL